MTGNPDSNTPLHRAYGGLQQQLRAGLNSSRAALDHPVAKGAGTEANWLKMLQDHLPRRYQAEAAFVIDAQGGQSDQIDIVLYDRQYTPELYNVAGQKIIPAEGVYAVFEVKPVLDRANVEYAGQKAASVRALSRTSAAIVHAGGEHEARPVTPIIAGILTTEPGWNPPFGEPLVARLSAAAPDERLDIGCVASAGGFEALYGEPDLTLNTSPPDFALAFFFLRLLHRLQRIGTVPALDYDAYLKAFDQVG